MSRNVVVMRWKEAVVRCAGRFSECTSGICELEIGNTKDAKAGGTTREREKVDYLLDLL